MHCFYAAGMSFVLSVLSIDVWLGEIGEKIWATETKQGLRREKLLTLLIYLRGWDSFILFLCRFIAINLCRREAILRGSTLVADVISPQSPLPCPSFPIPPVSTTASRAIETFKTTYIQLFRESLSEKMCTRQSWKVICYMINTLFLTTVAVEPTFVALLQLSDRKHTSVASRALSNFFEEQCTQNTHNTFRDYRVHFVRQPFSK